MNPNAKEFVPAYLLKRRQEESVNQLADQVGQVDLVDEEGQLKNNSNTMTNSNSTTTTTTTNSTAATTTTTTRPSENGETSKLGGDSSAQQHQHTNGTSTKQPDLEDDRYLLKGGEEFCEFNGEQFIIPGEDDEYDDQCDPSDPSDPDQYTGSGGFDFGNAEDNEDEDVCNAYEQFLDNLPE